MKKLIIFSLLSLTTSAFAGIGNLEVICSNPNNADRRIVAVVENKISVVKSKATILVTWGKGTCQDFNKKALNSPKKLFVAEIYDDAFMTIPSAKVTNKRVVRNKSTLIESRFEMNADELTRNKLLNIKVGSYLEVATFQLNLQK